MSGDQNGYFRGSAACTSGRLVGGGVNWGGGDIYAGFVVQESAPDIGGTQWIALVHASGGQLTAIPHVYAICASVG
jgi:hypothetical protein